MDEERAARLRAAGIDPRDPGDPSAAWRRLHDRFGKRATLIDRYALEAAARGIDPDALDAETRRRLSLEVLRAYDAGFEIVRGSGREHADPIEVVAYDPAWPTRFDAWRDRLAAALGATAVRIEHVGSTAVPGLAAKPVIDVQVSVPDVEDEPAYVAPIESAGAAFRIRETEAGHRYFRPSGARRREVHVHVCQVGSDWEQYHLLFRDFLRADRATREAYGALKLRLAAQYRDDRMGYTEAKTTFILEAMERARLWAAIRA